LPNLSTSLRSFEAKNGVRMPASAPKAVASTPHGF